LRQRFNETMGKAFSVSAWAMIPDFPSGETRPYAQYICAMDCRWTDYYRHDHRSQFQISLVITGGQLAVNVSYSPSMRSRAVFMSTPQDYDPDTFYNVVANVSEEDGLEVYLDARKLTPWSSYTQTNDVYFMDEFWTFSDMWLGQYITQLYQTYDWPTDLTQEPLRTSAIFSANSTVLIELDDVRFIGKRLPFKDVLGIYNNGEGTQELSGEIPVNSSESSYDDWSPEDYVCPPDGSSSEAVDALPDLSTCLCLSSVPEPRGLEPIDGPWVRGYYYWSYYYYSGLNATGTIMGHDDCIVVGPTIVFRDDVCPVIENYSSPATGDPRSVLKVRRQGPITSDWTVSSPKDACAGTYPPIYT